MTLIILLTFEFGVARTQWAYEMTPGVFIEAVYALEDNVIEPGPVPTVAVFGSSRVQEAIAPRLLEENLGLGTGEAVNLAFPFGDVVSGRLLYERNRSKLSQLEVVVIGVEMWDLFGDRQFDPIEEFFLPFDERLEHSGKDRVSLLVSSVWKTYAMRKMSGYIFGGLMRGGPDHGPLADDGRLKYFIGTPTGPTTIDASTQFDDRFAELERRGDLSGIGNREELQRFIDTLTSDGVRVVIVHLPMRRDFITEVERRLPMLTDEVRRVLDDLDGPLRVAMETTPEALGIPDTHYRDYGHPAEAGVAQFTEYIASLIEEVAAP